MVVKKIHKTKSEQILREEIPEIFSNESNEEYINTVPLSEETKSFLSNCSNRFDETCEKTSIPFYMMTDDEKRAFLRRLRNIQQRMMSKE